MRFATGILAFVLVAIPGAALAEFDVAGDQLEPGQQSIDPGDICGECPWPGEIARGVTFKGGDMWAEGYSNLLYHYQDCNVVETIPISPAQALPFGLGYNSTRDLFILADPSSDMITTLDANGAVVNQWFVGGGPVGAAYDSMRDLYWWSDWTTDFLYSIDPNGIPGPSFHVPAGSRIAGLGYDAANDALVYNGRDQGMGYWCAADGSGLIDSYVIPFAGANAGAGVGVDPATTNVWFGHYEEPAIYCIEGLGGGGTPTLETTWSIVKDHYK